MKDSSKPSLAMMRLSPTTPRTTQPWNQASPTPPESVRIARTVVRKNSTAQTMKRIMKGVKKSIRYFDVGGITLEPKNPKETAIKHSQKKWGGKEVKYKKYSNA